MSIHIEVSQGLRVDDLKLLQDQVQLRGGRLIAYAAVMSVFFICARSYRVSWVPSEAGRGSAGIASSAVTAILGWWAFHGPYQSIAALVWNGRGGLDITDALLRADPRNTSLLGYSDARRFAEFEESGRRISMRIFWGLVLLVISLIAYMVWRVSK